MAIRRFVSESLLKVKVITVSQTPEQLKDKRCNITGYVTFRKPMGKEPILLDDEVEEEWTFTLIETKQATICEILVFHREHKKPSFVLTVDNQARKEDYGIEGIDHETDPH